MLCFLSIKAKVSQSKNRIRMIHFSANKSLGAGRVVHLIEGTAFSCSQVQDIVPFLATEGEGLYILNCKLINTLFSLTHMTSMIYALAHTGPVFQCLLIMFRTSVLH